MNTFKDRAVTNAQWIISIFIISICVGLCSVLVYFLIIRGCCLIEEQVIDSSVSSIESYINEPTDKNLSNAIIKHEECFKRIKFDFDCMPEKQNELINLLIENEHIDINMQNEAFFQSLSLKDGIHSNLMARYKGTSSVGLFLKADALVRQGELRSAMPIYKLLFHEGRHYEVATRLRGLLTYYGCRSDFEIWGEYSEQIADIQPTGSPYPAQEISLSVQEVIEGRIRLRNGEFVSFMPECPLSKITR